MITINDFVQLNIAVFTSLFCMFNQLLLKCVWGLMPRNNREGSNTCSRLFVFILFIFLHYFSLQRHLVIMIIYIFTRFILTTFLKICILIINCEFILFTITEQDVMRKFKNLRTTYSRELHKIKGSQRSGAGADDVVTSTWVYFSSLDAFLRPHVTMRATITNLVSYYCCCYCCAYSSV